MGFELHHGDCLDVMATLSDASIDCVLTDPPYGTTACKWDSVIPFAPMWEQLNRIIKPKGAIVLFGSEPFSSALRMSNIKHYKYDWIWDKIIASGFNYARYQPMRQHELISVFYDSSCNYDFNGEKYEKPIQYKPAHSASDSSHMTHTMSKETVLTAIYKKKRSILQFSKVRDGEHPTQKPVALMEYLIRTYTNENETVLDFTMGSGSTGVACELENRSFIGIEKDAEYFKIATNRIEGVQKKEPLFAAA